MFADPRRSLPALIGAGAVACAVVTATDPPPAVRVPAGLLLALVLPGIAVTAALFPRGGLVGPERLALPPAASLAVLALGGVALHASGVGLAPQAWAWLTAGVTVAAAAVAALRDRRSAPPPRPAPPTRDGRSPASVRTRLPVLVLALAVLAGAAVFSIHSGQDQRREPTTLWATPVTDTGGGSRATEIGVRNGEPAATAYSVEVADPDPAVAPQRFGFTLKPGHAWRVEVPVTAVGRLTVRLFRSGHAAAYRTVFVTSPGA